MNFMRGKVGACFQRGGNSETGSGSKVAAAAPCLHSFLPPFMTHARIMEHRSGALYNGLDCTFGHAVGL
eukprot:9472458-Pyramimonas_sp.AAC.1